MSDVDDIVRDFVAVDDDIHRHSNNDDGGVPVVDFAACAAAGVADVLKSHDYKITDVSAAIKVLDDKGYKQMARAVRFVIGDELTGPVSSNDGGGGVPDIPFDVSSSGISSLLGVMLFCFIMGGGVMWFLVFIVSFLFA